MNRTNAVGRMRLGHLFGCTALAAASVGTAAIAQGAPESGATLSEVLVTAQKREQNLQDVPIAVTAITEAALQSNRVTNVNDLNNLVPNLSVRVTAGGVAIPSFTMRGITSYGVVAGSEKEISIYIDGVYLGATRGSVFDFPEISRIEVLRGPQGTLFGRNATAGAVSIITRDPPGKFGVRQELTYGNYRQFRSKTRLDLPKWGPFSATITYVHDERRGDIKNLGAGATWLRPGIGEGAKAVQTSPKYLGDKDLDAVFAAVRFEPTDNIDVTYKFDYGVNHYTPEGVAPIALSATGAGAGGTLLATIVGLQPTPYTLYPNARRPKSVNNNWTTPGRLVSWGHNLTAVYRVNDDLTIKNIFSNRHTYVYTNYEYSGLGGLVNPIPALGAVGAPFVALELQNLTTGNQWSDEAQVNYNSKIVTLTAGALYFNIDSLVGQPPGWFSPVQFSALPNFTIPKGPEGFLNYNYSTSKAAYLQAEVHATSQLDVLLGYRITQDHKRGTFIGAPPALPRFVFSYEKTKPSYMAGLNYKPTDDVLVYGKYSTGFVSGGAVGTLAWLPETARSWEGGVKADFLDRRLRTNLALYTVKYTDIQSAQAGFNIGHPELPTVILDLGDAKAKGFEFEATAVPLRNLTIGGSLGYTHLKYTRFTALALPILGSDYKVSLMPTWTSTLWTEWVSDPLFGEAEAHFRMDAGYHSKLRYLQTRQLLPSNRQLEFGPSEWTVNGRAAIEHIKLKGGEAEVAIWARNLTNNKEPAFANGAGSPPIFVSSSFVAARTFGVDVIFTY